jgi:hypothetical protein
MTEKTHKGSIASWHQFTNWENKKHVFGLFLDHPKIKGFGTTSEVICLQGTDLETRNSRYTLIGPDIGYDEYIKRSTEHRRANRV